LDYGVFAWDLVRIIKKTCSSKVDWPKQVPLALYAIQVRLHGFHHLTLYIVWTCTPHWNCYIGGSWKKMRKIIWMWNVGVKRWQIRWIVWD